ncbi:ABC transporter substrate-binding protein [Tateyamaria sp. SN6-1]|uniref:ABC transporter substrate-binding protein n=1 Tax=Tateyamaria sp. SN6-1 TaxID=3092148 RepID=UPI0039F4D915
MRLACLALGLILWAASLAALEVEDHQRYPGTGPVTVRVLSTADREVFEPFILRFQAARPEIGIDYTVASSAESHRAIQSGAQFDLVISSAMDLQFQLANDGFARPYSSDATASLPDWARWRDHVFAFTSEPAVTVISTARFDGLARPTSRQELISLLRDNPDRFQRAVGTYDIRSSGLGYLFATQEARNSDAFWRLSEVMGRLDPQLYCCSGQMIDAVARGDLAIAYNVLGSYAAQRLAEPGGAGMQILELEDFANVMLRTALIPASAQAETEAGAFLDALLAEGMRLSQDSWVLPPLNSASDDLRLSFGPIRLGPALMVYLDPLKRRAFLESWGSAMEQPRN